MKISDERLPITLPTKEAREDRARMWRLISNAPDLPYKRKLMSAYYNRYNEYYNPFTEPEV